MKQLQNTTMIYIPGLFDHVNWVNWLQRRAVKTWKKYGGSPEVFTIGWADESEFDPRLDALCERIMEIRGEGRQVALIGASAGASAVVGALARLEPEISAAVIICGKVHRPQIVPDFILEANEVFDDALDDTQSALEELSDEAHYKMVSLRSAFDAIVPPRDSIIPDARNVRMPIIGHIAGIGYALLRYGRYIVRFCLEKEKLPPLSPDRD